MAEDMTRAFTHERPAPNTLPPSGRAVTLSGEITMTELNERSRTYYYLRGGQSYQAFVPVRLERVVGICVRPSGNHRLKTADGMLHIMPPGFVHIEIDADDWVP